MYVLPVLFIEAWLEVLAWLNTKPDCDKPPFADTVGFVVFITNAVPERVIVVPPVP